MNTKVKVGIAAAIVAALIALIVLDQNTTPGGTKNKPDGDKILTIAEPGSTTTSPPIIIKPGAPDEITILKEAENLFGRSNNPPAVMPEPGGIKRRRPFNGKEILPDPDPKPPFFTDPGTPLVRPEPAVEYVIQQGDTYEDIAKAHYGSRRMWNIIAEANPQMPPHRLRVGKKIQIPAKSAGGSVSDTPNFEPDALTGDRTYTVRPGDTLSGISVKVFNTSRHTQKIFDANREVIDDPNFLVVGTKLYMPNLAVRRPSSNVRNLPGAGTDRTVAPPGSKVHQVQPNESLWKIAERYAGGRGILQTIRDIVTANGDKLESDASLLRVGWKLIIPE